MVHLENKINSVTEREKKFVHKIIHTLYVKLKSIDDIYLMAYYYTI